MGKFTAEQRLARIKQRQSFGKRRVGATVPRKPVPFNPGVITAPGKVSPTIPNPIRPIPNPAGRVSTPGKIRPFPNPAKVTTPGKVTPLKRGRVGTPGRIRPFRGL